MRASLAAAALIEGLDKTLIAPSLLESTVASLGALSYFALGESMITSTPLRSGRACMSVICSAAWVSAALTRSDLSSLGRLRNSRPARSLDRVAKSVTFATRAWQDVFVLRRRTKAYAT
jgi:hypothetical protein